LDAGLFVVPFHPPERSPREVFEWGLEVIGWADELGYREAWVGEHFTLGWEPCPAPDAVIAAAIPRTSAITLAPGAHLLPYHHPAELAMRAAWLDQVSQGRYMLGIGAGAYPQDAALFGLDGQNAEMMQEALEIMLRVWAAEEPFRYAGRFWTAGYPEHSELLSGPWLKPYQLPHPPLAMAGLSPRSPTLRVAGANGYIPLSLHLGPEYLRSQWDVYVEGAAEAGRTVERSVFRVAREVFVADTDEEARRWAIAGGLGRTWGEYLLPLFTSFGLLRNLLPDPDVPIEDVTLDYLADNLWLIGSPDTVVAKLDRQFEATGGWGTLLAYTFDYIDNPEPFRRSLELFAREVAPRVQLPSPAAV
jgi:alkanesulfonate monooxygenase SsuD/methylene tetrahydromethanopterin reductase-like flavin-dependent oxidoreductase (luciferase family)